MIPLTLSPDLKAKAPGVAVGWITANVQNTQHDEALWHKIEAVVNLHPSIEIEPVEWHDSSPFASHPKASHNTLDSVFHASAPNAPHSSEADAPPPELTPAPAARS